MTFCYHSTKTFLNNKPIRKLKYIGTYSMSQVTREALLKEVRKVLGAYLAKQMCIIARIIRNLFFKLWEQDTPH